jgi:hypothetical protein
MKWIKLPSSPFLYRCTVLFGLTLAGCVNNRDWYSNDFDPRPPQWGYQDNSYWNRQPTYQESIRNDAIDAANDISHRRPDNHHNSHWNGNSSLSHSDSSWLSGTHNDRPRNQDSNSWRGR